VPEVTPSKSFERVAESYDATRGGEERGERVAAELAAHLDSSRPVLEVGMGTGVVALALIRLGFGVAGVDISAAMLRRAVERIGPRAAQADASRMPFPDGAFEQAYSVWVLHVVGDPEAVLQEVGRVLAPGGRYLVAPARGRERSADEIDGWLFHMSLELGVERRMDDADALREPAERAGLKLAATVPMRLATFDESPAETARQLEVRSGSILWELDDETFERVVRPVIERILALPDADTPLTRSVQPAPLVVLEKPAAT